jgi:hypothetical protein
MTTKKILLESVRQISRQKPAKASVVRQPKKVYGEMIEIGAKSITIVRAVTADFFFDRKAAEFLPMSELGTYHGTSTIMRKTLDWSFPK